MREAAFLRWRRSQFFFDVDVNFFDAHVNPVQQHFDVDVKSDVEVNEVCIDVVLRENRFTQCVARTLDARCFAELSRNTRQSTTAT